MNEEERTVFTHFTKQILTMSDLKAVLEYLRVVITPQEMLSAFDRVRRDTSYTADQVDAIASFIAMLYD